MVDWYLSGGAVHEEVGPALPGWHYSGSLCALADTDPPFITNQNPAPGEFGVAESANILFRVDDLGAGINLATLTVYISEGGGPFVLAISGGSFVAPYNGAGSSTAPGGTNGYDVVIDPVSDLVTDDVVQVRVLVDDNNGNSLDVTYLFYTAPAGYVLPVTVMNDGGAELTIQAFAITAGTYIVHLGPNGDVSDPIAYNGRPGSGGTEVIFEDIGGGYSQATFWTPPLPTGGPYNGFLEGVGIGNAVLAPFLTVIPHYFRSGIFSYRRLLPNHWKRGPTNSERERFPQP